MEFGDSLIGEDLTILQAMERLDKVGRKVLFLLREDRLVATLTDGDIRRWILSRGALTENVSCVANYNPKFIRQEDDIDSKKYMKKYSIEALPVLGDEDKIIKIIYWDSEEALYIKEKINTPVVIMAGGLGTRLYPYTKILPKPLIPIGDLPIAEHIINQFKQYGCSQYYLIVNHKKNMIKAYFSEIEKDYEIHYVDENMPLGTGGGLSLLKGQIDTTFILTNCDILVKEDISKIYHFHKNEGNMITMVCSLKNFVIPYGVVEIGARGEIAEMREKPKISFFTNTGCYIVEPEVIDDLPVNISIGFPDIIEKYKNEGKKVGVYPISENSWLDMGQLDELERMKELLGEK